MIFGRLILIVFILSGFALAAPAPVPSDLVAWYAGDGNANDISGNGLNPSAALGAPAFSLGKVSQAMKFFVNPPAFPDTGYSVPDNDLLDIGPADSFSIEFWASADEVTGIIVDKREANPLNGNISGYAIYKNFNGTLSDPKLGDLCNISINFHQIGMPTISAIVEPTNCLHGYQHYAFVFDRPANSLRVYIGGALRQAVTPGIAIGSLSNNSPLFIAHRSSDYFVDTPWSGSIDELSFYKKALSAGEIAAINAAGREGKDKSVILPPGMGVMKTVADLTATFPVVTNGGILNETPLDPALLPSMPPGYLASGLFYDISTTALFSGNAGLCFNLPLFEDAAQFSRLRLLHLESGAWVNKTTTSDFATHTLCGQTSSFSPFAIAEQLAPSAAMVSISGRVINAQGRGIAGARVSIIDQAGGIAYASSNSFGYYRFEELAAGETYILSANSKRHQFDSRVVTPTENLDGIDFFERQERISNQEKSASNKRR